MGQNPRVTVERVTDLNNRQTVINSADLAEVGGGYYRIEPSPALEPDQFYQLTFSNVAGTDASLIDLISTRRTPVDRSVVALSYRTTANIQFGATAIPITPQIAAGTYDGHYVTISNGTDVAQRWVTEHVGANPVPGNPLPADGELRLSAAVGSFPAGSSVTVLVRTTAQDGADVSTIPTAADNAEAVWLRDDRTLSETPGLTDEQAATLSGIANTTGRITFDASDNVNSAAVAVGDKSNYSLSAAELERLTTAIENAILNEADGRRVIDSIVQAIGNENLNQGALVAAIRDEIERDGGTLAQIPQSVHTELGEVGGGGVASGGPVR